MKFPTNRLAFVFENKASHKRHDFNHEMPFIRSKGLILVIAVMTTIFAYIAINTAISFGFMDGNSQDKGLFSLVIFVFMTAWLIGWSIPTFMMFIGLLIFVFGRAVLVVHQGRLEIRFGMPLLQFFIGLAIRWPAKEIDLNDLVLVDVPAKSIFPKEGQALLIKDQEVETESTPLGGNFNSIIIDQLKSAITKNNSIESGLDSLEEIAENLDDAQALTQSISQAESKELKPTSKTTLWMLLAVNMIPLLGLYFLNWQLGEIMVLYWAETVFLFCTQTIKNVVISPIKGMLISFFMGLQITAFMAIHFLFIWVVFVQGVGSSDLAMTDSLTVVGDYLLSIWPAFIALFISHIYSLIIHFFNNPKPKKLDINTKSLMSRVVLMHLVIIFGGFLVMATNSHLAALCLLVALKTYMDAKAHMKHHGI